MARGASPCIQSDHVVRARPTIITENGGEDVINKVSTINAESRALSKFTNKQVNVSSASTVDET
jgi:hypothetical protein